MQTRPFLYISLFISCFTANAFAAYPSPLKGARGRGMVAADHLEASRAGAELLGKGGNAVDAAVATALALGVVAPSGSGLGGGGFLVYWRAREKRAYVLDFREAAPAAATRDMFVVGKKFVPEKSRSGGLAVAVPGEPAGLAAIETRFGKLGLAAAILPAARLAREGFTIGERTAKAAARSLPDVAPDDALGPWLKQFVPGARVKNEELARSLELFAKQGIATFYQGAIGATIVDAVRKHGGVMTIDDLAAYQPIWRDPLQGHYRGRSLWTVPPPAGGATLIEALQILDARPPLAPLGAGSSAADHQIAEALKHAFADRAHLLGDPAFFDVPLAKLIDPAYARELAARITDQVGPSDSYGMPSKASAAPPRDHGTSHLCVADGDGDVVALTTTINLGFGAKLSAAGILLNDQMDDFAAQPGVPNAFGLIGGEANSIAPGKRPLSSMSPVILTDANGAVLCAGGSGGPLIVSETAQSIINVLDFNMDAEAAVSSPRIHAQWVPDVLFVDPEIPSDVRDALAKHGHKVKQVPEGASAAQVIILRPDALEAASDPRKGGTPAAPPALPSSAPAAR